MIWGMSTATFTSFPVVTLIGIGSGLVVLWGFEGEAARRYHRCLPLYHGAEERDRLRPSF